jgi:hypothetical protein
MPIDYHTHVVIPTEEYNRMKEMIESKCILLSFNLDILRDAGIGITIMEGYSKLIKLDSIGESSEEKDRIMEAIEGYVRKICKSEMILFTNDEYDRLMAEIRTHYNTSNRYTETHPGYRDPDKGKGKKWYHRYLKKEKNDSPKRLENR